FGGAGNDQFILDFGSGVNIIPTAGPNQVAFIGGGGSNGVSLLPGYSATNVDYTFGHIAGFPVADPQLGTISIDGRGVTYQNVTPGAGIGDDLVSANRSFTFDPTLTGDKTITLGDDPTPNNGDSRLRSSNAGTPIVDFR